jgi:hypothetical protein
MSYAQRSSVTVTTAADGSATAYLGGADGNPLTGRIINLVYAKTDFADGVDFTITADGTGQTIWTQSDVNASATVAPRQPTHSTAGVASLYASGGVAVNDHIVLAADRIKIVIANGGDTKSGTFTVVMG